MGKAEHVPSKSMYRGIRVTLTQAPGDRPSILTLSVKHVGRQWDEWNLLFPAIRVPARELTGYRDVLVVMVQAVEALLAAEEESR